MWGTRSGFMDHYCTRGAGSDTRGAGSGPTAPAEADEDGQAASMDGMEHVGIVGTGLAGVREIGRAHV